MIKAQTEANVTSMKCQKCHAVFFLFKKCFHAPLSGEHFHFQRARTWEQEEELVQEIESVQVCQMTTIETFAKLKYSLSSDCDPDVCKG
jgi:hypothetical protein